MTIEINNIIGPAMYFGFVEAFHLDFVLACIIHIAQRDKVSTSKSAANYLSIMLVVIISLLLVGMYVFMAYTVERLSKSYRRHVVLDIRHMKDERYRMWLEDKAPRGNIFQRHFNLLCLIKDIVNTTLLYSLYYHNIALMCLTTVVQIFMVIGSLAWPPYLDMWTNNLLRINQVMYFLLDIMFLANVVGGDNISPNGRYYFIGFVMISIVMVIIVLNVAIPLYYSIKELIQKCKKKREKQEKANIMNNESKLDQSDIKEIGNSKLSQVHPEANLKNKFKSEERSFKFESSQYESHGPSLLDHKLHTPAMISPDASNVENNRLAGKIESKSIDKKKLNRKQEALSKIPSRRKKIDVGTKNNKSHQDQNKAK